MDNGKSNHVHYLWRLVLIPVELRLKKSHKPFQFAQMWDEFCVLYTDSKPDEISRGEVLIWNMKDTGVFCRDIKHRQIKKMCFFCRWTCCNVSEKCISDFGRRNECKSNLSINEIYLWYLFQDLCERTFKEVMLIFGFDFQDMPRSDVEFAVPRG